MVVTSISFKLEATEPCLSMLGLELRSPKTSQGLAPDRGMPLIVDLDGTLVRSDLLVETAFELLGRSPSAALPMLLRLASGKAVLKSFIAARARLDPAELPYDSAVLELIQKARASGQPVYLASASHERYVRAVAEHLGVFDGWLATTASTNLSGKRKADALQDMFGEGGFDYVGNDAADLAIWRIARRRIAVGPSPQTRSQLLALDPSSLILKAEHGRLRDWLKMLRVHQWAKNTLVFVPLLTAQAFTVQAFANAALAFLAFSIAASAIYIINDLVDIDSDRRHPTKRARPLAAGTVPIRIAMAVAPILVLVSVGLALAVNLSFAGILLAYLAITTAYSFSLKRKMMVDVVVLALLYTIRVVGGAAAISVPVSEWLLGFSVFVFAALALIKRFIELAARLDADLPDPTSRNYRKSDLGIVSAMAAAASFNAVTVFALYISSETVHALYSHPRILWLICPILMYWLGRALMLANRRMMHDDPIVFALRDWNSMVAAGMIGAILIIAK